MVWESLMQQQQQEREDQLWKQEGRRMIGAKSSNAIVYEEEDELAMVLAMSLRESEQQVKWVALCGFGMWRGKSWKYVAHAAWKQTRKIEVYRQPLLFPCFHMYVSQPLGATLPVVLYVSLFHSMLTGCVIPKQIFSIL